MCHACELKEEEEEDEKTSAKKNGKAGVREKLY